ncbi:hypothetical protein CAPTEDRAFT_118246 [Capitella teleta]|uniref:G-protein coupled receptors family 1 profile domain-containing protein n=1 Tax=Capitella teleta TaxID=283909 RepID=R7T8V5_CAPTE|nr:hypothetical protein CAPTEDRAFT_118246 [Capitella teleta]|eukprot:ELT87830.1 hypothetical protein CAPTEDRAFT_118246 [Capitella teleta]
MPLIPVIVLTSVANTVIVLCVYSYRPLQRPSNYYVASLALADAIVGIVVMPGMLMYTVHGEWPLSYGLCTVWIGLDYSFCTISMLHLCLIAQDRHCALTRPAEYISRDRTKIVSVMTALAWVLGLIAWVPAVVIFRARDFTMRHSDRECLYLPGKLYTVCQSCIIYVTPTVIMLVTYTQCVNALRKHFRKIASIQEEYKLAARRKVLILTNISTNETLSLPPVEEPGGRSGDLSRIKPRRYHREHQRSVRTLGVVICGFLLCWLPFCITWPVQSTCDNCVPSGLMYSYWAAYFNSTVNPLLYFACNRDFRRAFKHLVGVN